MKAILDEETCVGCGLCVDTCPEVFEMTDDTAKVIISEIPADAIDSCSQAEEDCPVDAIKIEK